MRTQQNQWGFLTIGLVVWALSGCAETIESSEGETKNPVPTLSLPDPSGKYALSPEEDSLVELSLIHI